MGGVKTGLIAGALALVSVGVVAGQEPPGSEAARAQQIQARFQILAIEGVLERAVQLGAQRVRAEVQAAAPDAPDMLFITGVARARGFWLDGYGVFFDVDVPAMRRSLTWTLRVLEQGDRGLGTELASLKRLAATVENPAARRDLQQTIQADRGAGRSASGFPRRPVRRGMTVSAGRLRGGCHAGATGRARRHSRDPGAAYTTQVKDALVEAMIEYSSALPLGPTEWLTVAARDQDVSRLQPGGSVRGLDHPRAHQGCRPRGLPCGTDQS